jgi:hypothetical protein
MNDKENMPPTSGATAGEGAGGPGMPVGARRLFIIGCLGVLGGILAGRFYFNGLVLAVAGASVMGLALTYRDKKPWFSPMSWLVCVAGVLWTAITAAYGWSISTAADAASALSGYASVLFYSGVAMLIVMGGGVAAAVVARMVRRRRGALS